MRDATRELDIPVIASLNGSTPGGWAKTAELLQLAGADAIELNVYGIETDRYTSAGSVEDRVLRLIHAVRHVVTVPVSVKLSPFYTAFANFAYQLGEVPVDGLVLFNRFLQPRIDLATLEVEPELTLSHRHRASPAAPLDRDPPRSHAHLSRRDERRAHRRRRRPRDPRGRGRRDDDLRAAHRRNLTADPDEAGSRARPRSARVASVTAARGRLSQSSAGDPRAYERAQYVRTMRPTS